MVYLKSFVFNSLFYTGTGILVVVMGPVLLLPSRYARAVAQFWGFMTYLLLGMIGIKQTVSGDRCLDRQVLYAVKHQSAWETIILSWLLAAPAFVLKRELLRLPIIGWFFLKTGCIDLPLLSETATFTNTYLFKYFTELYENNISNISLYLRSSTSLKSEEIKLSERIILPSNRLRGFERGKVGPKDGEDFIGGNYAAAINFSSTIPQLLENSENIDVLFFIDAGNVWGVDYFSGDDEGSEIRSSIGLGLDWLTPVGPLNFTLATAITKAESDKTETFRFNLGTTF